MVDEIRHSLHSLMGLSHDKTADLTRRFDKAKMSKWIKPASKTGRAELAKVREAAAAKKQQDADVQKMRAKLDQVRKELAAMRAELDKRERAVKQREDAINQTGEQALNDSERENELKRKNDDFEAREDEARKRRRTDQQEDDDSYVSQRVSIRIFLHN